QDHFGCNVDRNAYEGMGGASIVVNSERIHFDLIVSQNRTSLLAGNSDGGKVHFFCECKYRTNQNDLTEELKNFLKKALKVFPELQIEFTDNFRFLFITNCSFPVSQSDLNSVSFLGGLLGSGYEPDELNRLSPRVRILILSDNFLELITGESV